MGEVVLDSLDGFMLVEDEFGGIEVNSCGECVNNPYDNVVRDKFFSVEED